MCVPPFNKDGAIFVGLKSNAALSPTTQITNKCITKKHFSLNSEVIKVEISISFRHNILLNMYQMIHIEHFSFLSLDSTSLESRKCFESGIVFSFQFPFRFCSNMTPRQQLFAIESVECSALNLIFFNNYTFIFWNVNVHYNAVYTNLHFSIFIFFRGFIAQKKLYEATSITKYSMSFIFLSVRIQTNPIGCCSRKTPAKTEKVQQFQFCII